MSSVGYEAPVVSMVVPCWNEEANVVPMYQSIKAALVPVDGAFQRWELLFVDDGSTDGTAEVVRQLSNNDGRVRLVQLSRNFGHQAALLAGIDAARGSAIVTLDGDLQHPPQFIPQMLEHWRRGVLLVEMVRKRTEGISMKKSIASAVFYKVINMISGTAILEGVSDFRLMDRSVVLQLLAINDPKPFLRGTIAWMGYQAKKIEYVAPGRNAGVPSYTFRGSLRLARQAVLALSAQPLRFSLYASGAMVLFCLLYLAYAVVTAATGHSVSGWASIIACILIVGAAQLMAIGVLGEYVSQLFDRSRNLPPFITVPHSTQRSQTDD